MVIIVPSILGLIIFILVASGLYLIKNPEKLDKWSELYNRYKLFKDENSEKKIISSNLDYKITSLAKKINKESEGIIPYGLRLKWRNPSEIESYVKKNEVVVVLKKQENCDKNIVEACMAFVPKALLPKSRNCLDKRVLENLDSFVVKRILNYGNYDSAYNYYMQNVYNPFKNKDKLNDEYLTLYSNLDEIGFFTRVLLEEFRRLGIKLYGTGEEQGFHEESVKYLKFLEAFTTRKPGDNIKLLFNGDRIKVAIIFVAKKGTIQKKGIEAYTSRIEKDIEQGAQRIFVFSYAQRYDEAVQDANGYVIGINRRKEFINLNQVEEACRNLKSIRLIKKQIYYSTDASGNKRKSKYLLYEPLR